MDRKEDRKPRFRVVESFWFVTFASFIAALIYFAAVTWEKAQFDASQRTQLITMTNSFVSAFSENRGEGAPVPATFRRIGIEHFSQQASDSSADVPLTMYMPGTPGREIGTVAADPVVIDILNEFVANPDHGVVTDHRILNNRILAETFMPSIATAQSCVDCHNATLGADIYQIGDTMGAFVVQSDLTGAVKGLLLQSVYAFCIAFAVFSALALLERRRSNRLVQNLQARVSLQQQKAQAETQAQFLMSHDALTGLANRSMFLEKLEEALSQDHKLPIIAIVDLDEFKSVNDTFGHLAGDALLTEVAQRLDSLAEDHGGTVARLGGDEFALMLPKQDGPDAVDRIGNEILQKMRPTTVFAGEEIRPSCSIGLCDGTALDDLTTSAAMKAADDALFDAKTNGRDRFRAYDDDIRQAVLRRQRIINAFEGDLSDAGLRAVLQPQIDLATGQVAGFEALARLRLDDEEISPAEFVTIAEETGKVDRVDLFILDQATQAVARLNQQRQRAFTLSANMSSSTLQHPGLTETIGDILFSNDMPSDRLILEVTETLAVRDWGNVQKVFSLLRRMGVQAALDDFGTGYSSLSYLQSFGFDEVKIDKSFADSVTDDPETRFLVGSIITMTKGLGCRVVVEGIETAQQESILITEGAQVGQGYLYSKPMELSDVAAFLDRNASKQRVA